MKKKSWLVAGLILLVLILAFVGSVKLVLPGLLKKTILREMHDKCADCVLYMKSVDISLSNPGLLTINDIRFVAGEGGRSLVEARLTALSVKVALLKSSRERLVIQSVEGIGTEVIYADSADRADKDRQEGKKLKVEPKFEPNDKSEKKSDGSMQFEILSTKTVGALFRYAHTENKRTSILHIHEINASLGPVGSTPELKEQMATARLTGQIEKSGRGELVLAALLKPEPFYVDVLLSIENQNLGDLNTFFTPNDGLKLGGQMINAVAKVIVRGDDLKSHVEATYKDAEFKEKLTKDRSAFEAFLANLGSSLMMTKTNADYLPRDRMADLEIKRDLDEPLVHSILRSMKLCLLNVVKKSDSRKKK
jgi:hypothetical protein